MVTNASNGNGGVNGQVLYPDVATLYQVEGDLNVALSAVSAGGPAVPGTVAAAQNAVLNLINGDPVLASALAANPGGVGFQAMPVGDDSPAALTAALQFGASLHQNSLQRRGEPRTRRRSQPPAADQRGPDGDPDRPDEHGVFPDRHARPLAAIEANESPADAAATTAHLQTVLANINLQIQHDNTDTGATLSAETHANILAIIDTIHGDPALDGAVGGPHGNAHGELNVAPPHGVAEHFWLHHV